MFAGQGLNGKSQSLSATMNLFTALARDRLFNEGIYKCLFPSEYLPPSPLNVTHQPPEIEIENASFCCCPLCPHNLSPCGSRCDATFWFLHGGWRRRLEHHVVF